jgi:ribosomal protein S18 acetylase RimI-like enzyme
VTIERVREVTDELLEALGRLLPQLSSSAGAPDRGRVAAAVADERTALLVARDDGGRVVGALTLATYRTLGAHVGWVEDVVVDEAARGAGVGAALAGEAQRLAAEWRVDHVNLTSRASREAANRLYRRAGFEQRETNVYRWRPSPGSDRSVIRPR